jgi:hypothetical protein
LRFLGMELYYLATLVRYIVHFPKKLFWVPDRPITAYLVFESCRSSQKKSNTYSNELVVSVPVHYSNSIHKHNQFRIFGITGISPDHEPSFYLRGSVKLFPGMQLNRVQGTCIIISPPYHYLHRTPEPIPHAKPTPKLLTNNNLDPSYLGYGQAHQVVWGRHGRSWTF